VAVPELDPAIEAGQTVMAGLVPAIHAGVKYADAKRLGLHHDNRPNGILYTGVRSDIARRAYEHREGLTPGFTKRYGLKRLVYVEFYERIADAIQRESNIKHWPRAWKARLILDANPGWNDLYETLNQ
jgi:putative endonuclease